MENRTLIQPDPQDSSQFWTLHSLAHVNVIFALISGRINLYNLIDSGHGSNYSTQSDAMGYLLAKLKNRVRNIFTHTLCSYIYTSLFYVIAECTGSNFRK